MVRFKVHVTLYSSFFFFYMGEKQEDILFLFFLNMANAN